MLTERKFPVFRLKRVKNIIGRKARIWVRVLLWTWGQIREQIVKYKVENN